MRQSPVALIAMRFVSTISEAGFENIAFRIRHAGKNEAVNSVS